MQATRTTAVGFGFRLTPCAPPCSSSGCSDSLPVHHLQPQELTVQPCATRTHHCPALCHQSSSLAAPVPPEPITGCSCATRTHHWLLLCPSKEERQPDRAPAAGQQHRVTSGHGQGWAVPSSPGAGQEPQPSPGAQ